MMNFAAPLISRERRSAAPLCWQSCVVTAAQDRGPQGHQEGCPASPDFPLFPDRTQLDPTGSKAHSTGVRKDSPKCSAQPMVGKVKVSREQNHPVFQQKQPGKRRALQFCTGIHSSHPCQEHLHGDGHTRASHPSAH